MRSPHVEQSSGVLAAVPESAHAAEAGGSRGAAEQPVNEVRIVGRLGVGAREVTLPSGDTVVTFHVVVSRPPRTAKEQERRPREPTVDTLACAAWTSRSRRTVLAAQSGDLLEVDGALRRRFRRSAGGSPVSFYEVEVTRVRCGRAAARSRDG